MPFIDGIELAKLLKRDFPTVKVAFISGYDEFKYAKRLLNSTSSVTNETITSQESINF
jgi:two-component system response regulator YesN